MDNYEYGKYVSVIGTGRIGMVTGTFRKMVDVSFYDTFTVEPESLLFRPEDLAEAEVPEVTWEDLRRLARGETGLRELSRGCGLLSDEIGGGGERYLVSAADLLAGVRAMQDAPSLEIFLWIDTLMRFGDEIGLDYFEHVIDIAEGDETAESEAAADKPEADEAAAGETAADEAADEAVPENVAERYLLDAVDDELWILRSNYVDDVLYGGGEPGGEAGKPVEETAGEETAGEPSIDLSRVRTMLEDWISSGGETIPEEMAQRVASAFDDDTIDSESETVQALFKRCLDLLCDKKVPDMIQKRGYCYYCGTKVYPNDWFKARDAFLEYYSLTGDASAANTLGYIFYYGRCNNGVPEYDKAFMYFSIGHAFGYYESTYKLADMFAHGYGVKENGETANRLYWSVYRENVSRFRNGDFGCKFADAALRVGNCFRDGIGCGKDPESAYFYYLQADLAIRERTRRGDYYGDTVVYSGVQRALKEAREAYTEKNHRAVWDLPRWADLVLSGHRSGRLKIREEKDGVLSLDVSILQRYDEPEAPMILLTVPSADYCALKKHLRLKTSPGSVYELPEGEKEIVFDHFKYDWNKERTVFYLGKKETGRITAKEYILHLPGKKKAAPSGKKLHFAGVRFGGSERVYDYICDDTSVAPGDRVIVEGYSGETEVEVAEVSDRYESELALEIGRYKKIIRKA